MEKICVKCETTKDVSGFNHNKYSKDGLQSWCKACVSQAKRTKRFNAPAHARKLYEKQQRKNNILRMNAHEKGLEKVCIRCEESFPATAEHWYRGNGKHGYKSSCKKCDNKRRTERRKGASR